MGGDLLRGLGIDLLGREAVDPHGHDHGDFLRLGRDYADGDAAREAVAGVRGRVGDDLRRADKAVGFERHQFRVAGADANAVESSRN